MCVNIGKIEVVLFKSPRNYIDVPSKVKLNGKRMYPIDENLDEKQQISDLAIKLSRENTILSKLKRFMDRENLKPMYSCFVLHKIQIQMLFVL